MKDYQKICEQKEDGWRDLIRSYLTDLTSYTVIGTEFIIGLLERDLIGIEEKETFENERSEIRRASILYTSVAKKWDLKKFEEFKVVLEITRNSRALKILSASGSQSTEEKTGEKVLKRQFNDARNIDGANHPQGNLNTNKINVTVEEKKIPFPSKARELMKKINKDDLSKFTDNIKVAWKLMSTFSREELFARITNEETRDTDIMGMNPRGVWVALGDQFVPWTQLAEFRMKFGDDKGMTVFEIGGRDFDVDFMWRDYLTQKMRVDEQNCGPLGMAVREALCKMGGISWWLIEKLEGELWRWSRQEFHSLKFKNPKDGRDDYIHHRLMEWVTKGQKWINAPYYPLYALPFLLRYYGDINPFKLSSLFQQNKGNLQNEPNLLAVLRSLVISSTRHHNDSLHTYLVAFLLDNFQEIPPEFRSLVNLLLGATREELFNAAPNNSSSPFVCEISVWLVFLKLLPHSPTADVTKKMLTFIVSDVIQFTPCCDLPPVLHQIRLRFPDRWMREVLKSKEVLHGWGLRLSSQLRRRGQDTDVMCAVSNLLSFYFSFEYEFFDSLDWMGTSDKWPLVKTLPLEIAKALKEEPKWTHLLQPFQEMLRKFLKQNEITSVGQVAKSFYYKTEEEWERLLQLIGALQSEETTDGYIPMAVAAPLIRVLMKKFGAKAKASKLWSQVPSTIRYSTDNVSSLGSLLHSAIQLDELYEVKRLTWPGLVSWRNKEGKTALEVAVEKLGKQHQITNYLHQLKLSLDKRP